MMFEGPALCGADGLKGEVFGEDILEGWGWRIFEGTRGFGWVEVKLLKI